MALVGKSGLLNAEQEASDENTIPDRLRYLAGLSDSLARSVAGNPGADIDLLIELGARYPAELLANPVFALLLLETPDLIARMPAVTVSSLLGLDPLPVGYLEQAAGHPDPQVQLLVVNHRRTGPRALERLSRSTDPLVAQAVSLHVLRAGEWRGRDWKAAAWEALDLAGMQQSSETVRTLVDLGAVPEEWVERLNREGRRGAAGARYLSVRILEKLCCDPSREVRRVVAASPQAPPRLLERLAYDEDSVTRGAVAANPATPGHLLTRLAAGGTAPGSLPKREMAVIPEHRSEFLFQKLAEDPANWPALARDPWTPGSALERIVADSNTWLRSQVALNPRAPLRLLEYLATFDSEAIRTALASNANLSGALLARLAVGGEPTTLLAVARHPKTPGAVLAGIANDWRADRQICAALTWNPAIPGYVGDWLAGTLAPDAATTGLELLLDECPADLPSLTRFLLFMHPVLPGSLLRRQVKSPFWAERFAIAQNPSAPADVASYLSGDTNRLVRAAASRVVKTS